MEGMVPDSFHDRWDGRHWRWWALLAGVVLTALAIGLAAVVSTLTGEKMMPLTFLFVTALLFVLSMIGSGMFDGLASRTIAGGLARQPAEDTRVKRAEPGDTDRHRRDRRTIRAGLAALPIFVTFIFLLFG